MGAVLHPKDALHARAAPSTETHASELVDAQSYQMSTSPNQTLCNSSECRLRVHTLNRIFPSAKMQIFHQHVNKLLKDELSLRAHQVTKT